MTKGSGRTPRRGIGVLRTVGLLAGLSGCAQINDRSAALSVAEAVALIEKTARSELTPKAVAGVFARNSRSTGVQRDMLQTERVR